MKKYSSVAELFKGVSQDAKFKEKVSKGLKGQRVSNFLFFLRCEHKFTQKDLAGKIGCSQSRVSKIEAAFDDELTVKDLMDYGRALNLQLEIGYRNRSVRIVDAINYHVGKIREYLRLLVSSAKGDAVITKGVVDLSEGILGKVVDVIGEVFAKLEVSRGKSVRGPKEEIHISIPIREKKTAKEELQSA